MWLEEKNQKDPYGRLVPAGVPGTPSIGAGGGAVQPTGTQSNPSTESPASGPQPEQKFATVQDYLGANQQQGEQLGQNFTAKLGDTANQERSTIAGAADTAKNDINANNIAFDSNIVNTAVNDPTKVANDPGQLDSFLKQWNASYKGPESFEASTSYGTAADAATKANEKGEQLKTAGGQQQLLQDEYGVYGQGNKGLDQALLQTSSSYPKVQDQAKEFGTIQDYLRQQAGDVNAAAKTAKTTTEQTKASTQTPFANKLTEFQGDINSRVGAARTQADAGNTIKRDLASGDSASLTKDLAAAGISNTDTESISQYLSQLNNEYQQKPDLINYYTANPSVDVNPANVATPEDYAKASAYQKLTGVNYGGVLNPAEASLAGTANTKPQIDSTGLSSYLHDTRNLKDNEFLSRPIAQANLDPSNVQSLQSFAQNFNDRIKRQAMDIYGTGSDYAAQGQKIKVLGEKARSMINQIGGLITRASDEAVHAKTTADANMWRAKAQNLINMKNSISTI